LPAMRKLLETNPDDPTVTTVLHRVDRSRNMARFYCLQVTPSLFGDAALVRSWGRLDTPGRIRIDLFGTRGEAEVAKAKLAAEKLKKGYRPAIPY